MAIYVGSDLIAGGLPNQAGQNGKYLTTDGVAARWDYVDVSDKIDKLVTLPEASSLNLGLIVQYVGTTTTDYTNGYFYQSQIISHPLRIEIDESLSTIPATLGDPSAFVVKVGAIEGTYTFTYISPNWVLSGAIVDLAEYTITPGATPVENDTITVVYAEPYSEYVWANKKVQPDTVYPHASTTEYGVVKVDGETIVSNDGVISGINQVDNFRGRFTNCTSIPTSISGYNSDLKGNKTPLNADFIVITDASDYTGSTLQGTWKFVYIGTWSVDGVSGWKPEYLIESTLPTATSTAKGIMKLYTSTGTNTDGTMDQNSINTALGTKQDTLSGSNSIDITTNVVSAKLNSDTMYSDVNGITTNNIVWRKW